MVIGLPNHFAQMFIGLPNHLIISHMKVVVEMNLNDLDLMIMFCFVFRRNPDLLPSGRSLVTRSVTPRGPGRCWSFAGSDASVLKYLVVQQEQLEKT